MISPGPEDGRPVYLRPKYDDQSNIPETYHQILK